MKAKLPKLSPKLTSKLFVVLPVLLVLAASLAAFWILTGRTQFAEKGAIVSCEGDQAAQFSCWQARYKAMVAKQSPAPAFADFRTNYEMNPYVKSNCHQIGHVIGRAASQKYETLAETYKQGDNFCWSGYYHGAIETVAAEIGKEKIVAQLSDVCRDFQTTSQYSFDHYNCVHGMGHGILAIQDDNLFSSLETCNGYMDSWQQDSCFSGVFMENVMNEVNPGKTSAYLKQDDPLYPCTAVEERYKQQCYLMQTSHALTVVSYDYAKVFELCSQIATPNDVTCYQSLGRDVSGQSSSDQARTIELCMLGATAVARENCFTGAVKDYISYHHSDVQGKALCVAIPDASLSSSCTNEAVAYYRSF